MAPPLRLAGDPLAGDLASTELDLEPGLVYKLDVDLDLVSPPPDILRVARLPPLLASNNFLVSLTVSGAGSSRSLTPNKSPGDTGFIDVGFVVSTATGTGLDLMLVDLVCLFVVVNGVTGLLDRRAAGFVENAFFAGKLGEFVVDVAAPDMIMFSLTRAGLEERTWLTGGGVGGSALDSLGGKGGGDTLGGRASDVGSRKDSVYTGLAASAAGELLVLLSMDNTSTL